MWGQGPHENEKQIGASSLTTLFQKHLNKPF